MTPEQKQALEMEARQAGLTLSDYVKQKLGLSGEQIQIQTTPTGQAQSMPQAAPQFPFMPSQIGSYRTDLSARIRDALASAIEARILTDTLGIKFGQPLQFPPFYVPPTGYPHLQQKQIELKDLIEMLKTLDELRGKGLNDKEILEEIRKLLESKLQPQPKPKEEDWIDKIMKQITLLKMIGRDEEAAALSEKMLEMWKSSYENMFKMREQLREQHEKELEKQQQIINELKDRLNEQYFNMLKERIEQLQQQLQEGGEIERGLKSIQKLMEYKQQLDQVFEKGGSSLEKVMEGLKSLGFDLGKLQDIIKGLSALTSQPRLAVPPPQQIPHHNRPQAPLPA